MGRLTQSLRQARKISTHEIRTQAQRPFRLLLVGADESEQQRLLTSFLPETLNAEERSRGLRLTRAELAAIGREGVEALRPDVVVLTPAAARLLGGHYRIIAGDGSVVDESPGVVFDLDAPDDAIPALLRRYPEFHLALGRTYPMIREYVARHLIRRVAKRNASFAGLTAIPEVVPTPATLVWALGGFASDSIVLTANQIRLAFQLAALHGDEPGWLPQFNQLASIVAGAFGFRAVARAIVGMIPAGAGLVAKMGVAYGGTLAVGEALLRRYQSGKQTPLARIVEARTVLSTAPIQSAGAAEAPIQSAGAAGASIRSAGTARAPNNAPAPSAEGSAPIGVSSAGAPQSARHLA